MRGFRTIALALGLFAAPTLHAEPARVVSMNVCTDQLAMLIAAPGQLVSVSHLARDLGLSAMAEAAEGYPVNHGRAEEIYLLEPDLVLASTFSNRATVAMLRRVGIEVAEFPPATALADIPDRLRKMGEVLDRGGAATDRVSAFEAALDANRSAGRGRAALYGPGGYYRGGETLAGDIVAAAGFGTISDSVGRDYGGFLPLELLVMAEPDLIVTPGAPETPSRSHAVLDHPALAGRGTARALTNRDWVCGTPAVLDAIDRLAAAVE
ncbi:MAG: ABC transporter substrate-binding protein [Paracoccaceae bacterium]|nr:ABC transporter substrate-binding protein [Paracoccaceae bacterium]